MSVTDPVAWAPGLGDISSLDIQMGVSRWEDKLTKASIFAKATLLSKLRNDSNQ